MLKLLIICSISLFSISYNMDDIFSLNDFRWENRIIIINSDEGKELSEHQKKSLMTDMAGLKDRHLLIFEIDRDGITDLQNEKVYRVEQNFLDKLQMKKGEFEILLIGKDGGVKLRSSSPLENSRIFGVIDQMPMRQAEMRNQKP